MLPSSKRPPPRHEDDVIRTGDYEVVKPSPSPGPRAAHRRPIQTANDEEQTLLFRGSTKSMLPPRPETPAAPWAAPRVPNVSMQGLVRRQRERPQAQERTNLRASVRPRVDAEDRTILRPTSDFPPPPRAGASAPPPPVVRTLPPEGGRATVKSYPPGDPPSSVITARTRILHPRSGLSWAAGLLAIGAAMGLATAVIARGDADSVLDATATFVDPSHGVPVRANAAAAQAAVLPAFVDATPAAVQAASSAPPINAGETTVSAPVVINAPPAPPTRTASNPGADPESAARPSPPRPAPVAYAAPARRAPHPAAVPWASHGSSSRGWLANVTPPNAGGPIARPSHASRGGGDLDSAQAADALAKAQLEASLR